MADPEACRRCEVLRIPTKIFCVLYDGTPCNLFDVALDANVAANYLSKLGSLLVLERIEFALEYLSGVQIPALQLSFDFESSQHIVDAMHVTLNRTSSRYIYEELLGNALGNHRMQDLYIHCAQEARKHIVRTISVLAATKRLQTVHLNTRHSRGTRRQALFGWIAFAFFSRLSASSVLNLVMVVEALTLDDIASMDQVINSSNPIQALLQSEEVGHRTAVLLENVKIELDPPMTLVKGMRVWVIDDKPGSSVLTAMIPGVGVYHLCRSLVSTSPEADGWTKITHFDITLKADSPTNSDGLLALLGIIGSQLISLSITIKSSSHTITSHDISHVLHACPQLEHLDLHNVQVENLDTFVDAYDRHNCRIRVLQLRKLRVTIHTGMTRFFTALSDSTNRMT